MREHLYILKIRPTNILYHTLFLIVCQPFFLLFVPDERAMTIIIPDCLRQCHTQSVNLSPVDGKGCQGFVFNCPLMMQHRILSRTVFLSVLKSMDRYLLEKHYLDIRKVLFSEAKEVSVRQKFDTNPRSRTLSLNLPSAYCIASHFV